MRHLAMFIISEAISVFFIVGRLYGRRGRKLRILEKLVSRRITFLLLEDSCENILTDPQREPQVQPQMGAHRTPVWWHQFEDDPGKA